MSKRMTVVFDDEGLYTALKVAAVRSGQHAKDIVAQAVRDWLQAREDEELQAGLAESRREWERDGGREAGEFFADWTPLSRNSKCTTRHPLSLDAQVAADTAWSWLPPRSGSFGSCGSGATQACRPHYWTGPKSVHSGRPTARSTAVRSLASSSNSKFKQRISVATQRKRVVNAGAYGAGGGGLAVGRSAR